MPKDQSGFSKKDIALMQRACLLCDKSVLGVRTGCVITKGGVVLGEGWNCDLRNATRGLHDSQARDVVSGGVSEDGRGCDAIRTTAFRLQDSLSARDVAEKGGSLATNSSIIHAEMCALQEALSRRETLDGGVVYVSRFPCMDCAEALISQGISKVFYMSDHFTSGNEALSIFEKAGVSVVQISEEFVWEERL
jgi:deoxycytidylate deaminase